MKALLRRSLVSVVGSVTLLFASTAFAEGEPCYNDTDCPNPACGGDVCNWAKQSATPDGMKVFYCQPAGGAAKGADGWCTTDDNCKCKGQTAKCVGTYCSFTKASDAPAGGGGTGAGGTGAGGTGTTAAGTGTTAAGTGTTAAGTGSTTPPKEDSGGCSVGSSQNSGVATMALVLGALGLGVTLARRRR